MRVERHQQGAEHITRRPNIQEMEVGNKRENMGSRGAKGPASGGEGTDGGDVHLGHDGGDKRRRQLLQAQCLIRIGLRCNGHASFNFILSG